MKDPIIGIQVLSMCNGSVRVSHGTVVCLLELRLLPTLLHPPKVVGFSV